MSSSDAVQRVQEVLERIAEAVGVDADVSVLESDSEIVAEYIGGDVAPLIGHHGTTIDAIQQLAYRMAFQGMDDRKAVVVDAAGYRARRAESLRAVADQAAETAVRDKRPVPLEVMGPQERKVVHEHLKGRFDVETYSEGQEPSRHLVVAPLVD
jgi:spoIIIJ-associated protein